MAVSLLKTEEEHILRVLPTLLKRDEQFKGSLYTILGETFIKRDDFSELKDIVKELALAQKKTEVRVEELAEAQKRTEEELRLLASEVKITRKELKDDIKDTRINLSGLGKSMSYALENEAFRMIPGVLKEKYGIQLKEKLIRTKLGKKEINIFGKAEINGEEVVLVGETQLRLDETRKKDKEGIFKDLKEKAEVVSKEYQGKRIEKLLIAHFATPGFIKEAEGRGIIVIQSFEW
ncbi:MAG: hypothetical protein AB1422_00140 [bacterium]